MKLHNVKQINELMELVQKSHGDIWIESKYGDKYSLKSKLTRYLAIAELINDNGEDLEIFCKDTRDESALFNFFKENPDTLGG